jgi:hypothetical protein
MVNIIERFLQQLYSFAALQTLNLSIPTAYDLVANLHSHFSGQGRSGGEVP